MSKIFSILLFVSFQISVQTLDSLKQKIEQMIPTKKADVGVSITGVEYKVTNSYENEP